jgi:purine/pyrimidine-nucleoside phosphorylase
MQEFNNVTVVKKANVYFGGKVTSRTVVFPNGEKKTLGIMLPGDYEFSTDAKEIMEVLAGSMDVLLPGAAEYRTYKAGDVFEVPAKSSFKLTLTEVADYCCSYIR